MNPLFSIVLPTYNRSHLLPRAIHSVLRQIFCDFELIVVDDYSIDNTRQVLLEFSDPRITVIQHLKNQGVSVARNTALEHARGEYICFLDDDDEFLPDFLQEIYHFLKKWHHPFVGLIWTGVAKIDRSMNELKNRENKGKGIRKQLFTINKQELSFLSHVLFSGVTIHRTCFERVGVFNPRLKLAEDTEIFVRMLAAGLDCAAIPKVLINIHIHEYKSLSRSTSCADKIANLEYFLNIHDKFINQHLSLWLHYYTSLAGDYYRSGEKQKARKLVKCILKKCWHYTKIWEIFLRFELS